MVASPLEDEHVARIRAYDTDRIEVLHEPDLLPTPRYVRIITGSRRTSHRSSGNDGPTG
jgi:hypothetical protein